MVALMVHRLLGHVSVLWHCHAAGIHLLQRVHRLGGHHLALVQHGGVLSWRPDLAPLLPGLLPRVVSSQMVPCIGKMSDVTQQHS